MLWLGTDWATSCELFRQHGAQCDCQILMISAEDKNRDDDRERSGDGSDQPDRQKTPSGDTPQRKAAAAA
jgi:hypothetical protein